MHNAANISPDGRDADDIVHESNLIHTLRGAFTMLVFQSCKFLMMFFLRISLILVFCYFKRKIICVKEEVLLEEFASWCQGFGYMFGLNCTKSVTMPDIVDVDNGFSAH